MATGRFAPSPTGRLHLGNLRTALLAWIRELAALEGVRWLIPAHYDAPVAISAERLEQLAQALEERPWAPSEGSWALLASIDQLLLKLGLVPAEP